MSKLLPACVAETIGTFALCFFGIMAIQASGSRDAASGLITGGGLLTVAIAHGVILSIVISIFGATSGGHFNPAVTVGLLVGGKIKPAAAAAYLVSQIAGGFLAGLAVLAIYKEFGSLYIVDGTPAAIHTWSLGAVVAEGIATFFLVLAVWGTAVDPRAPKIGGFGIGLTVMVDILAIGPVTGAAMNPARAFGPALVVLDKYDWSNHWIFWVGPLAGGILASLLYKNLILPKDAK